MDEDVAHHIAKEGVSSLDTLRQLWVHLETTYWPGPYRGLGHRDQLRQISGGKPMVLTAPHAVEHEREGWVKKADKGTGGLAECLALALDCYSLTVVGAPARDANVNGSAPLRAALSALCDAIGVQVTVVDLHGMSDDHGVDVCIARGAAPSPGVHKLVSRAHTTAVESGLSCAVDHPFSAGTNDHLVSALQSQGHDAVAFEIAARFREPYFQPDDSLAFMAWLHSLLSQLLEEV